MLYYNNVLFFLFKLERYALIVNINFIVVLPRDRIFLKVCILTFCGGEMKITIENLKSREIF